MVRIQKETLTYVKKLFAWTKQKTQRNTVKIIGNQGKLNSTIVKHLHYTSRPCVHTVTHVKVCSRLPWRRMPKVSPKVGRRRLAAEIVILTQSRKNLTKNKFVLKLFFTPVLVVLAGCNYGLQLIFRSCSKSSIEGKKEKLPTWVDALSSHSL